MSVDLLQRPESGRAARPRSGAAGRPRGASDHGRHRRRSVRCGRVRPGLVLGSGRPPSRRPARGRPVLHHRPRHHDRLPSDARPSVLRRLPAAEARIACLGLDGLPRRAHRLGGDHRRHHVFSDQADDPHSPHRYGQRRRSPASGVVALPGRLAVHAPSHLVVPPRRGSSRRSRRGEGQRTLPAVVRRLVGGAVRARVAPRGWPRGRVDGAAVGRRGALLLPPSRDVERQLPLPHLRTPAVPHHRPQHQPRGSGHLDDG